MSIRVRLDTGQNTVSRFENRPEAVILFSDTILFRPSLTDEAPMKSRSALAITCSAVLALSSAAAYALPENFEARL